MKKLLTVTLVMVFVLGLMGGVVGAGTELPNWNIEGEWVFSHSGEWWHDMNVDSQDAQGNISGDGGYPAGEDFTHYWLIDEGTVSGNTVEFLMVYQDGYEQAGLVIKNIGEISDCGKMIEGTWEIIEGGSNSGIWVAEGEAYWIDYHKAAPAVAAELLKEAGIDVRYGSGRTGGNHIADVAHEMGDTTDFDDVSKCDTFAYEYAVADFLNTKDNPAEVAYPVSELQSVVYEGEGNLFGDTIGDALTFTFSNDIVHEATKEVTFDMAERLWEGWGDPPMSWEISDNLLIVTATGEFSRPRDVVGDKVIDITGLVDAIGNDVIVPADGMEVTQ